METVQPILAIVFVLALLGGTLYWLRVKGLVRFSGTAIVRQSSKHMQALERLSLTPQHSLHLVSVDGRTLLVAISPGGCTVIDGVLGPDSGARPGDIR